MIGAWRSTSGSPTSWSGNGLRMPATWSWRASSSSSTTGAIFGVLRDAAHPPSGWTSIGARVPARTDLVRPGGSGAPLYPGPPRRGVLRHGDRGVALVRHDDHRMRWAFRHVCPHRPHRAGGPVMDRTRSWKRRDCGSLSLTSRAESLRRSSSNGSVEMIRSAVDGATSCNNRAARGAGRQARPSRCCTACKRAERDLWPRPRVVAGRVAL